MNNLIISSQIAEGQLLKVRRLGIVAKIKSRELSLRMSRLSIAAYRFEISLSPFEHRRVGVVR
jgi:hypothetical protein